MHFDRNVISNITDYRKHLMQIFILITGILSLFIIIILFSVCSCVVVLNIDLLMNKLSMHFFCILNIMLALWSKNSFKIYQLIFYISLWYYNYSPLLPRECCFKFSILYFWQFWNVPDLQKTADFKFLSEITQ